MNRQEFLVEMHEYLDTKFTQLLCNNDRIIEIFKAFHQLCIREGITYFVCFGSLLAQIRDDGFIPWDSDFDVCIPVTQIEKLLYCLNTTLPEEFFYESNFTTEDYPYFQLRIGMRGYDINISHLDVFYVIGGPTDEKQLKRFQAQIVRLFASRMNKHHAGKLRKTSKTFKEKLIRDFYMFRTCFYSYQTLDKKFKKVIGKYSYLDSQNLTVVCHIKVTFQKKVLEPVVQKNYHGIDMLVPQDEISILNCCYKNYKEYLPIQKRFDEFYSWVKATDSTVNENINYRR